MVKFSTISVLKKGIQPLAQGWFNVIFFQGCYLGGNLVVTSSKKIKHSRVALLYGEWEGNGK
jgi:hypothetical protein